MNLTELFAQQQKEIENFKTLRDETWSNLKNEHETLIEAFGGRATMPEEYRKRIDDQIANFSKEWSMEGGLRHNDIIDQHNKQREAITGKKNETLGQPKQQETDMISEKQKKLEKIIAQQQAIRKKNEERKKSRKR